MRGFSLILAGLTPASPLHALEGTDCDPTSHDGEAAHADLGMLTAAERMHARAPSDGMRDALDQFDRDVTVMRALGKTLACVALRRDLRANKSAFGLGSL